MQASLIVSGTSKSGCPIEKLIGSFIFAARSKTLRMPLESKALVRSAKSAINPYYPISREQTCSRSVTKREPISNAVSVGLTQRRGGAKTQRGHNQKVYSL